MNQLIKFEVFDWEDYEKIDGTIGKRRDVIFGETTFTETGKLREVLQTMLEDFSPEPQRFRQAFSLWGAEGFLSAGIICIGREGGFRISDTFRIWAPVVLKALEDPEFFDDLPNV